jgi:hypothetical protein
MGTRRRTPAKAVTLTISALLGLGALAGCSGGNSAAPAATKSASKTGLSDGCAAALLQGRLAALRSGGRWGEAVHLTAPANTVPASSVTPVSSVK